MTIMPSMSQPGAAIEEQQLVREFRKGPRAVDGIDLSVQRGEIYGFLGPNGAGKSTTVLMLTTLLPPTSGHATVGGFDIVREGSKVRAAIGAALQEAALDMTPTGLDPQSRAALWEEVARLARDEGMTVFLTTQYLEEADALADRIGIIDRGRIVAEGTPAQLKAEIGSPSVEVVPVDPAAGDLLVELLGRFGASQRNGSGSVTAQLPGGEAELAEIVRLLDSNHLRVESLQLHQPSLDDVFLAKTGRKLEGAGEK